MFWSGEALRQKAETVNNKYSSRSHTIFTFYFTQRTERSILTSRINFVDLAGSEKYETLSNEVDRRKLEARHINKSLYTLQSVIIGLNQRQRHVPFRDSTLTRFLKDSLVGNVKTAMIATLSTHRSHAAETLSTCRFAESVASVSTTSKLHRQELPPHEMVAKLRDEVGRLREELSRCRSQGSRPITPEETQDLQHQVVQFIEDERPGAILDVTEPERVQLCFRVMKELLRKSDEISELRRDVEERERRLESLTRQPTGVTKEAAYLKFCNDHKNRASMQRMKETIRERCGTTKRLNEAATLLKRRCDELAAELEAEAGGAERRKRVERELAGARAEFQQTADQLRACKDEVIRLQTELTEQREVLNREFEAYWIGTIQQETPKSPGPKKTARKTVQYYSHS
jgi:kinesin family protein 6/9